MPDMITLNMAKKYTDKLGSGITAINNTPTGFELITKSGITLSFTIPNMHSHTNLNAILEKLSLDSNGKLLFNGQPIKESIDLSNYVEKESGKGLFTGDYNDLFNRPVSQQPNKPITFTSSDWIQDSVDTNKYTLEITHGLKTKDIVCAIYNSLGKRETAGEEPIDIDRLILTSITPFSGKVIINYSSTINNSGTGIADLSGFTSDDLTEGINNKYITPSEKAIVESINITSPTDGQVLSYDDTTDKWVNESIHDEKVKMSASDIDTKYLSDLLDNVTIQNVNGKLVIKNIDGVTVGITNLNTLQGMTENIKSKFDSLANAMKFTGTVTTKADLNAVTGIVSGDVKIVLTDETNLNKKITYVYDGTAWHSLGEFNITVRNFSTNPIDLTSEITGVLPLSHVESSTLVKKSDIIDDLLHTDTNKPVSSNQAKILKDQVDTKTQINDSGVAGNTTDTYSIDKIIALLNDKQNKIFIQSTQPNNPSLNTIWIDTTDSTGYSIKCFNGTSFIKVGGNSSSGMTIENWSTLTSYTSNTSFVINDNLLYRCKTTHTSTMTFESSKWDLISGNVTVDGVQTLTNKTMVDSSTKIIDEVDNSKVAQFEASGITTGNTRIYSFPDKSGTIALTSDLNGSALNYYGRYISTNQAVSTGVPITFQNVLNTTLGSDITYSNGYFAVKNTTTNTVYYEAIFDDFYMSYSNAGYSSWGIYIGASSSVLGTLQPDSITPLNSSYRNNVYEDKQGQVRTSFSVSPNSTIYVALGCSNGSNLSSLNNGKFTIKQLPTSTYVPANALTPTTLSYLAVYNNTSTTLSTKQIIPFTGITYSSGSGITYDTTNKVFYISKTGTYKLTANFLQTGAGYSPYAFWNCSSTGTLNTLLTNDIGYTSGATSYSDKGLVTYATISAGTYITLADTLSSTSSTFAFTMCYGSASIEELPTTTTTYVPANSLIPTTLNWLKLGGSASYTTVANSAIALPKTSQQGNDLTYNSSTGVTTVGKTSIYKITYKAGSLAVTNPGVIYLQTSTDGGTTWTIVYQIYPESPSMANTYYSPQEIHWEGNLSSGTYVRFFSVSAVTQGASADIVTYPSAYIEELPSATVIQPNTTTVNEWTAYTPTITATTTNPVLSATSDLKCAYRIVGKAMYIKFNLYVGSTAGNNGSGNYMISLPSGYTIDTSLLRVSTNGYDCSSLGSGMLSISNNSYTSICKIVPVSNTLLGVWGQQPWTTNSPSNFWSSTFHSYGQNLCLSFNAEIPIL